LVEAVQKWLPSPIPFEVLVEVTRASFAASEALKKNCAG